MIFITCLSVIGLQFLEHINCDSSSVWHNDDLDDDDEPWRHIHPQRIYLVFNGYTQEESEKTLGSLNLTVNGIDIINDNSNLWRTNIQKLQPKNKKDKNYNSYNDLEDNLFHKNINKHLNFENNENNSFGGNASSVDITKTLRSSLDCSKGAAKACTKACKKVLKQVCDDYKCRSGMKSMFKKECSKNCKYKFMSRSKEKDEDEDFTTSTQKLPKDSSPPTAPPAFFKLL